MDSFIKLGYNMSYFTEPPIDLNQNDYWEKMCDKEFVRVEPGKGHIRYQIYTTNNPPELYAEFMDSVAQRISGALGGYTMWDSFVDRYIYKNLPVVFGVFVALIFIIVFVGK